MFGHRKICIADYHGCWATLWDIEMLLCHDFITLDQYYIIQVGSK